ncbi:zinc-ribbon domain-containing protein [Primorskyibacter sp. S87]|uniref:zinc-ribbon domain-containing protein n=1 Tax=Primorskyibacter sp. S87 TaxID=3415126 RepID=UPI003C7A155E
MRLTCPNCGAQYEVPDEVIPPEGRDVQCSNCGDTWYHAHPDHPELALNQAEPADAEPTEFEEEYDSDFEDQLDAELAADFDEEQDEPPAAPPQRDLDSSVSDILREEAERESRLRAEEGSSLESQPDLGLEESRSEEGERRAREAQDRMARIRGENPQRPDPMGETGGRRDLLPDIEEINSTLRSGGERTGSVATVTPAAQVTAEAAPKRKRSGFSRGIAIMLILGAILFLIYSNAPRIAESVPQADPMLSAYVALVDQGRVWLAVQFESLQQ